MELPPEPVEQGGHAPEAAPRTVEQLVRDTAGPNLDAIQVTASAAPLSIKPDGTTDFQAIYQHAGLPDAPFTAEQMLEMLASLPVELPLAVRRQTMKVTLGAMGKSIGASSDTIVADTSRKMAALAAYSDSLSQQISHLVMANQQEIAAMEAQIQEKRQAIAAAEKELAQVVRLCTAESERLDDVLEFFSLDVPPSKHSAAS